MSATCGHIGDLVMRIQGDYLEHPTLALTLSTAQRRFGVDQATCAAVLGALADARVLTEREGAYSRYCPRLTGRRAA